MDIPIELKVKRDALMFHLQYLIEATKSDESLRPELEATTRVLNDLNESVDTVCRQRMAAL